MSARLVSIAVLIALLACGPLAFFFLHQENAFTKIALERESHAQLDSITAGVAYEARSGDEIVASGTLEFAEPPGDG